MADDAFLDAAGWQAMLAREREPPPDGCIGIVRRDDFQAGRGTLLRVQSRGVDACPYPGGDEVAVLLVAAPEAVAHLRRDGLGAIRPLIRAGLLHPYMLRPLEQLEDAGLGDFVEDLGLVFPKH